MIRRILIASTALVAMSSTAFAQNNTVTVVREAVPEQIQTVIANSPQDLALQEEIRKIQAYNAQVDAQVGISQSYVYSAPKPAPTYTANPYQGRSVQLFNTPAKITYVTASGRRVAVTPTTITERKPALGYTRIHRVGEGDTLYGLATRNCVAVSDIQSQNALSDSNIRIGQVLTLPASKCAATTIAAASQTQIQNQAQRQTQAQSGIVRRVMPIQTGIKVRAGNVYAVLPKDNLYSIGKRFCVKADELASFNGLDTRTAIQPGQKLRLPGNACVK